MVGSSSTTPSERKQQLSSWGLPQPILEAFSRKGLKQLYPWQAAALECAAAGNNLVYCAPTSGGKSLVADVLMLARLHRTQQDLLAKAGPPRRPHQQQQQQQPVTRALIVLPYLSIVSEKTEHLTKLLETVKWRVMGYKGDDADGQPLTHPAERISICSIEKANGAINRMIQEERLQELVSVTIDEAHMLADPNRGAALEMLLSKLMASRGSASIQIVAMSATMSGLDSLSSWLDAHLFLTNFRPVPLTEHAVFSSTVYVKAEQRQRQRQLQQAGADGNSEADCILEEQRELEGGGTNDRDSLLSLVSEVVAESHSVLVFCAGRAAAQSCANMLSEQLPKRLGQPAPAATAAARADLIEQLRIALSGCSDPAFEKLLAAGVAYHHAGLTHQERAVVEQGFSSGALLVLTATSTLAAGVNLPARRVILRSLWQGVGDVSRAQYLQMVGRAGRAGHSAVGESFLMGQGSAHAPSGQWSKVCRLLAAPLPVLHSQLVQQQQPERHDQTQKRAAPGGRSGGNAQSQQQQQPSLLHDAGTTQSAGCSSGPIGATATAVSQRSQGVVGGGGQQSTLSYRDSAASGPVGSACSSGAGVGDRGAASGAASLGGPSQNPCGVATQQGSGRASDAPRVTATTAQPNMQHLLLDAVATGLVTTGQTVLQLLQNTLAYFHLPFNELAEAAKTALSALRARKLISLKPDGPDGPSHWQLTPLGSAVVASALAPDIGLLLHGRLANMLTCMVLGSNLHLLYVLQPDPLLTIFDWTCYNSLMRELSPQQRRVAEIEGLDVLYIDRRMGGLRGNAISDAQHGRFAAAVLLDRLVTDASSIHGLEQAWGKANTLTKGGISRGTMQRWQMEVSKTAAMAALLASNAGWWQLETLLAPLAAQVAAGVRPEVLPLMKVPGMQPSQAAALHAAGLGHPDLLLCASESEVAAALAAGLPANMRKRKNMDKKGLSVGLTGSAGTNAMVARAARSVLLAARQFAVLVAAEAAAAAAGVDGDGDDEDGQQDASLLLSQQPRSMMLLRTIKVLVGQATVLQVWPHRDDPLLACVLDAWQLQSSFALAVVLNEQLCAAAARLPAAHNISSGSGESGGGFVCSSSSNSMQQQQRQAGVAGAAGSACTALHGPLPCALVLCWADKEAVVLHLPSTRCGPRSSKSSKGNGRCSSSSSNVLTVSTAGNSSSLQPGAAKLKADNSNPSRTSMATAAVAVAAAAADGAGNDTAEWVWSVVDHMLGDPHRTVTCIGAAHVISALAAVGVQCKAVVDDPSAAFILWQPRGMDNATAAAAPTGNAADATAAAAASQEQLATSSAAAGAEEASKAAAAVVLSGAFKLHVPLLPGSNATAVTAAAKAALLGRALMPPLRALLAKQQLTASYESVEQPLRRAFADVRCCGLRVARQELQQQLVLCAWQRSVLQGQLLQIGQFQQQQQQQPEEHQFAQPDAHGSINDSSIGLLLRRQRLLSGLSNDRVQQQPLLQLVLLALKTTIKRKHTAQLPLLRLLLTYCHIQQHEQQLLQLLQHYAVLPAAEGQPGWGSSGVHSSCFGGGEGSGNSSSLYGCVVLQPHSTIEPVTGQVLTGWPSGLEGVLGFRAVPALPVLVSGASLAQQGVTSLSAPVTVVAAVQTHNHQQQQQQQQVAYVVGELCAIASPSDVAALSCGNSQQLPWQVPDSGDIAAPAAAAGSTAAGHGNAGGGGSGGANLQPTSYSNAPTSSCVRLGSVRVWCGVTETVRELQLPTDMLHTLVYNPVRPEHQHQQQHQETFPQQMHLDSASLSAGGNAGGAAGSGCQQAFLPTGSSSCSLSRLVRPSAPNKTFIGVQLQCLPLLVLAGLSQDKTLLNAACSQAGDPLEAAAAAWLPSSGLPEALQVALLGSIQAGVLDGTPVAAAAAPRLLFAAALQALLLGQKPSVRREALGVEWPAGTNLADSLLRAFPGVAAWRQQLLEGVKGSRFLTTCLGRRIPFRIPTTPGANLSKAAAKQIKEAERSAVSLMLLACIGDMQRLVAAAVQRTAAAWRGSMQGSGSSSNFIRDAGAGIARDSVAQGLAAAAAAAAAPGLDSTNAAAALISSCEAPGRLLPGARGGAPSGFSLTAAGSAAVVASQQEHFVVVGQQQVVLEVPSEWALPLLQHCSQQVMQEVSEALGLRKPAYGSSDADDAIKPPGAAAAAAVKLPFVWWWGCSLDPLQGNVLFV